MLPIARADTVASNCNAKPSRNRRHSSARIGAHAAILKKIWVDCTVGHSCTVGEPPACVHMFRLQALQYYTLAVLELEPRLRIVSACRRYSSRQVSTTHGALAQQTDTTHGNSPTNHGQRSTQITESCASIAFRCSGPLVICTDEKRATSWKIQRTPGYSTSSDVSRRLPLLLRFALTSNKHRDPIEQLEVEHPTMFLLLP